MDQCGPDLCAQYGANGLLAVVWAQLAAWLLARFVRAMR
jgi:hypothetical protein